MTRYLISFDAHAMDHIPDEEGSAVARPRTRCPSKRVRLSVVCGRAQTGAIRRWGIRSCTWPGGKTCGGTSGMVLPARQAEGECPVRRRG
jgi:hypothetical protein